MMPLGCETCTVTVQSNGTLSHEARCTIEVYREEIAALRAQIAAVTADATRWKNESDLRSGIINHLQTTLADVRAGLVRRLAPRWTDPAIEIIDAALRAPGHCSIGNNIRA